VWVEEVEEELCCVVSCYSVGLGLCVCMLGKCGLGSGIEARVVMWSYIHITLPDKQTRALRMQE